MFTRSNDRLKATMEKCRPIRSGGLLVPIVYKWQWGELVLMKGQEDDMAYYLYRRDSLQGKYCVVKWDGMEVLCTCQTEKGARRVCRELNALSVINNTIERGEV